MSKDTTPKMYNDIDKSAKVNKKVKASLKRIGDGKKIDGRGHLTKVDSGPVGMIAGHREFASTIPY